MQRLAGSAGILPALFRSRLAAGWKPTSGLPAAQRVSPPRAASPGGARRPPAVRGVPPRCAASPRGARRPPAVHGVSPAVHGVSPAVRRVSRPRAASPGRTPCLPGRSRRPLAVGGCCTPRANGASGARRPTVAAGAGCTAAGRRPRPGDGTHGEGTRCTAKGQDAAAKGQGAPPGDGTSAQGTRWGGGGTPRAARRRDVRPGDAARRRRTPGAGGGGGSADWRLKGGSPRRGLRRPGPCRRPGRGLSLAETARRSNRELSALGYEVEGAPVPPVGRAPAAPVPADKLPPLNPLDAGPLPARSSVASLTWLHLFDLHAGRPLGTFWRPEARCQAQPPQP
jgi:hypothetical protein